MPGPKLGETGAKPEQRSPAKFGGISRERSRPGALSQGNAPGNKGRNAGAARM